MFHINTTIDTMTEININNIGSPAVMKDVVESGARE